MESHNPAMFQTTQLDDLSLVLPHCKQQETMMTMGIEHNRTTHMHFLLASREAFQVAWQFVARNNS